MNHQDPSLSIGDAARITGRTVKALRRLADSGEIPHERTSGNQRRFRQSDLQLWMAQQKARAKAMEHVADSPPVSPLRIFRRTVHTNRTRFAIGVHERGFSVKYPEPGGSTRRCGWVTTDSTCAAIIYAARVTLHRDALPPIGRSAPARLQHYRHAAGALFDAEVHIGTTPFATTVPVLLGVALEGELPHWEQEIGTVALLLRREADFLPGRDRSEPLPKAGEIYMRAAERHPDRSTLQLTAEEEEDVQEELLEELPFQDPMGIWIPLSAEFPVTLEGIANPDPGELLDEFHGTLTLCMIEESPLGALSPK